MVVKRIVDDRAGAAALIAARGSLQRHAFVMERGLSPAPTPAIAGFSISAAQPDRAREYAAVVARAYPPEHIDHEPADSDTAAAAQEILDVMRGESMGPWIADASLHVADLDDRIVGQILVNDTMVSGMSAAGPFVTDICVDPSVSGHALGTGLLATSAARLAGLGWSTMTLVVTVGNPAQRLYERSGFRTIAETWRIQTAE